MSVYVMLYYTLHTYILPHSYIMSHSVVCMYITFLLLFINIYKPFLSVSGSVRYREQGWWLIS